LRHAPGLAEPPGPRAVHRPTPPNPVKLSAGLSGEAMETLIGHVAGFLLGMVVANAGEWTVHKYILHGLGRQPGSVWNYHLNEHHRSALLHGMVDPGYRGWPIRWNTQGKEVLLLASIVLLNLPLLSFVPGYVAGLYCSLVCYYFHHRKAHLDPAWARRNLPWHWEHHMVGSPEANWCTTWPWFDWVMGTRVRSRE